MEHYKAKKMGFQVRDWGVNVGIVKTTVVSIFQKGWDKIIWVNCVAVERHGFAKPAWVAGNFQQKPCATLLPYRDQCLKFRHVLHAAYSPPPPRKHCSNYRPWDAKRWVDLIASILHRPCLNGHDLCFPFTLTCNLFVALLKGNVHVFEWYGI